MTLLAMGGACCLAIAIASGDLQPLANAQALRQDASDRLQSAQVAQHRVASRVHDLEALRGGHHVPAERLEDLRSVVLDVAPSGAGFGVRWTHPLLDLPEPRAVPMAPDPSQTLSGWHLLTPGQRGPVAAFGLTLIFASVLSGGGERKIHASSPLLDDTTPQNVRSSGEPVMHATAVLAPTRTHPPQDWEWMPTPVDGTDSLSPSLAIDDEDEGDLFYFDDEEDDQDEDEDDGFFFDDDDDEDEDDDQSDELESDDPVAPDEEDDEEDSGFGDDDDEEYEFED